MKKIYDIFITAAAAVLLNSCAVVHPDEVPMSLTKGFIEVEVTGKGAAADDYIRKVRLIVFDDASSFPKLDENKVFVMNDKDKDAKSMYIMLEVNRNRDKAVAVIVNEPLSVGGTLDAVTIPSDLEDIAFLMADAFNTNHTSPSSTGLPMTGITWDISVTMDNSGTNSAKQVAVTVERAVARVELWLKTDGDISAEVAAGTKVTLSKSHDKGYLMGPDEKRGFGRMMYISGPAEEVSWVYSGPDPLDLTTARQMVSSFYVPERSCPAADDSDKPVLEIQGIECPDGNRNGRVVLSKAVPEGSPSEQPLKMLLRNNIYRITGTVKKQAVYFENEVVPWTGAGQGVIIDPQYYLRVSRDYLFISDRSGYSVITAETDYDRTDRGFPKGIVLGTTCYYDRDGIELSASAGDLFGWLIISVSGNSGDLTRVLLFNADKDTVTGSEGYYALVEVKAGNMTRVVRVTHL